MSDYGAFRDLQRHRTLTIDWQRLTPDLGYTVPDLITEAGVEERFRELMDTTYETFAQAEAGAPGQGGYVVPLGFNIRYSIKANARALMHMLELRTTPQAHPSYRRVAQQMHTCLLYTSPSPRDATLSRMPSSA